MKKLIDLLKNVVLTIPFLVICGFAVFVIGSFNGSEDSRGEDVGYEIKIPPIDCNVGIDIRFCDMDYEITIYEPCNLVVEYWIKDYGVNYTFGEQYEVQVKKRYITWSQYWITEREPRYLTVTFTDPNKEKRWK